MNGRLIAIGDIHGYNVPLQTLLQAIEPTADDIIVTLGDYVDRGPNSKGVIDTLIEWGQKTQVVALMGNHEEMMLDVVRGREPHHAWLKFGGIETLDSYHFNGDLDFLPPDHLAFFESLGDYFEHDNFFFTHAAYDAELSMELQSVEMLRWYSLREGIPKPHISGRTAVVGHTANPDARVVDVGHLICLDTKCYGGGLLTAMELPSKRIWQSTPQGVLLPQ